MRIDTRTRRCGTAIRAGTTLTTSMCMILRGMAKRRMCMPTTTRRWRTRMSITRTLTTGIHIDAVRRRGGPYFTPWRARHFFMKAISCFCALMISRASLRSSGSLPYFS